MAGYIGGRVAVSAPQQIETKHTITATASQTSITNVGYTVGAVHVYQNGIRLVDGTDYTATNGSTVTLETGATEGDQIVIVSHGSFETSDTVSKASGGTFAAAMNYPGGAVTGNVSFGDNNKAIFGAGSDLEIYHNGNNSIVADVGTGNLSLQSSGAEVLMWDTANNQHMAQFKTGAEVSLRHNGSTKLATTATGATITGALATDAGGVALTSLDIDGGTDIGAALVDADLMIVDDGAGGTNRKATMSRLATYMGGKITGGSLVYLASTGAISNAASVVFTQFDATKYDHYQFWLQNVIPVTDAVRFLGQTSTDGGSSYSTTNGDYHSNDGSSDATGIDLSGTNVGSDTNEFGLNGMFNLFAPHSTNFTAGIFTGMLGYTNTDNYARNHGGTRLSAGDVDAIKFIFSSGNIESGEIVMYGIANGT